MFVGKTKKKKKDINKDNLWDLFDKEINTENVECVYDSTEKQHNVEVCQACNSALILTDEGFWGCVNKTCGIVNTDMIEQGAEWRYYGADDNSNSDSDW